MNIAPVSPVAVAANPGLCSPAADKPADGVFGKIIDQVLGKVSGAQQQADKAVLDLATGRTDEIHNVMLAVAKADVAFRLVLQVRNRLTEAYQEITRITV